MERVQKSDRTLQWTDEESTRPAYLAWEINDSEDPRETVQDRTNTKKGRFSNQCTTSEHSEAHLINRYALRKMCASLLSFSLQQIKCLLIRDSPAGTFASRRAQKQKHGHNFHQEACEKGKESRAKTNATHFNARNTTALEALLSALDDAKCFRYSLPESKPSWQALRGGIVKDFPIFHKETRLFFQ